MREWVEAYNLPIITVLTKADYVPKTKVLNVVKNAEKQLGGLVLPFSNQCASRALRFLT